MCYDEPNVTTARREAEKLVGPCLASLAYKRRENLTPASLCLTDEKTKHEDSYFGETTILLIIYHIQIYNSMN